MYGVGTNICSKLPGEEEGKLGRDKKGSREGRRLSSTSMLPASIERGQDKREAKSVPRRSL